MEKFPFFRQHTPVTCGASCILMAQKYFGKIPYASTGKEKSIYRGYHPEGIFGIDFLEYDIYPGLSAACVAHYLSGHGMEVYLAHSSEHYLDNRDGYFDEPVFAQILEDYHFRLDICSHRIQYETGVEETMEAIREALTAGDLVMAQTFVPGNADGVHDHVLHWILLYGVENGNFQVCDPGYGIITLTEAELDDYMNTPIGRIYLTIRPKKD